MLLRYIKRYPLSLIIIVIVIYLSFFNPPSIRVKPIAGIGFDKLVHFLMYFAISSCIWIETFLYYRKRALNKRSAILCAVVFPVVFSGLVELLQELITSYRGGEWLDLLANTLGVLAAAAVAWYAVRPRIIHRI